MTFVLLLGQVGLHEGGEIGLSEHHVGGGAVGGRNAVVDQHAVVLRVGHIELAVLNPHALRSAHGLGVGSVAGHRRRW